MEETWLNLVTGSAMLLFAAIFAIGHYRREQRRARSLRQLDLAHRWHLHQD